jgi:hypothetical protein
VLKNVLVISAAFLLLGSSAMAQGGAERACAADIRALCAGVGPSHGRIAACVQRHVRELSQPCRNLLATTAAGTKACAADVKKNCAKARRRAAILVCMRSNLTNLSGTCRSALARIAARRSAARQSR